MKTKMYAVQQPKKSNVVSVSIDLAGLPSTVHKSMSNFRAVRFEDKRKKKPKYKDTYDIY